MNPKSDFTVTGVNATPPIAQPVQPSGIMDVVTPPEHGARRVSKIWEGTLATKTEPKPTEICILEGYGTEAASLMVSAHWPGMMVIDRLISQDHMKSKKFKGKANFLLFRSLSRHEFLVQMAKKKLCAVIQLPSQVLLLSCKPDKPGNIVGLLFPQEIMASKPNVSTSAQAMAPMARTGQAMGQTLGESSFSQGQTNPQQFSLAQQISALTQSSFSQGQLQGQTDPQQLNPQQISPLGQSSFAQDQTNSQQLYHQQTRALQSNVQHVAAQHNHELNLEEYINQRVKEVFFSG